MPELEVSFWRASNTAFCELRRSSRPICERTSASMAAGSSGIGRNSCY